MDQKFKKYDFVHCVEYDRHFALFGAEFDAIVEYSYNEQYGGRDEINDYSLFIIKNGKVVSNAAWYDEDQLTFVKKDVMMAEKMIEEYHRKRREESED